MAGGHDVAISLSTNYLNGTSVELRCVHDSSQHVAVGFYQKIISSNTFARTIAIGGTPENCMVTPLPDDIKCHCISELNMSCIISHLRPSNDDEEWKCAIPSNGIAVFSNVARLSVSGAKFTCDSTPVSVTVGVIISLIVVFALLHYVLRCNHAGTCLKKTTNVVLQIVRTRAEPIDYHRTDLNWNQTCIKLPTCFILPENSV